MAGDACAGRVVDRDVVRNLTIGDGAAEVLQIVRVADQRIDAGVVVEDCGVERVVVVPGVGFGGQPRCQFRVRGQIASRHSTDRHRVGGCRGGVGVSGQSGKQHTVNQHAVRKNIVGVNQVVRWIGAVDGEFIPDLSRRRDHL